MLNRRDVVRGLLDNRRGWLVVSGLGSPTWDVAAAGDDEGNFYLWGAMGGAVMVGLGIALAQPDRRVVVITGDGEMLMGLGSLATIALRAPANLAVVVLDNGHYGETGMQESHTARSTDLEAVARGCGIGRTLNITDEDGLGLLHTALMHADTTVFARVRIGVGNEARVLPMRDGVALKLRFRQLLGVTE